MVIFFEGTIYAVKLNITNCLTIKKAKAGTRFEIIDLI